MNPTQRMKAVLAHNKAFYFTASKVSSGTASTQVGVAVARTNFDDYLDDDQTLAELLEIMNEVRIDENESLLDVAQHEIDLPNHCDNHDKYSSHCHTCKKRKWYGEISKDWKRIINIRISELK